MHDSSPIHDSILTKGMKWELFNSEKVVAVSHANIQGRDALIKKFRNSSVMLEELEYQPGLYASWRDVGQGRFEVGERLEFPKPEDGKYRPKVDVLFCREEKVVE